MNSKHSQQATKNRPKINNKEYAPETYPWAELVTAAPAPTLQDVYETYLTDDGDMLDIGELVVLLGQLPAARTATVAGIAHAIESRRGLAHNAAVDVILHAVHDGFIQQRGFVVYQPECAAERLV